MVGLMRNSGTKIVMSQRPKKSKVTWVLIALTAIYGVAFFYLANQTAACDSSKFPISPDWFHGFWDKFLACRQINELGDTLGGAFAPIAFLWLAGTVFIQSQELAAQRQELDETQTVMREQLEVARQQVDETKASTALFQKQTEILEREQRSRDEAQADAEFDEMVENFLAFIPGIGGLSLLMFAWNEALIRGKDETELVRGIDEYYHIFITSRYTDLADLAMSALAYIRSAIEALARTNWEIDIARWDYRKFNEIRSQLEGLAEQTTRISNKHKILSTRYRLQPLLIELAALERAIEASRQIDRTRTASLKI